MPYHCHSRIHTPMHALENLKVSACVPWAPERDCAKQSTTEYSSKRKNSMQKTISVQIERLQGMSVGALREKYEAFQRDARSRNKRISSSASPTACRSCSRARCPCAQQAAGKLADEAHPHPRNAGNAWRGRTGQGSGPVEARPRLPRLAQCWCASSAGSATSHHPGTRHPLRRQELSLADRRGPRHHRHAMEWIQISHSQARRRYENCERNHARPKRCAIYTRNSTAIGLRARLQFARCPARGLRAIHRQPRPCRMVSPARALR